MNRLLYGALCCALLVGCGGGGTPAPTPTPADPITTPGETPSASREFLFQKRSLIASTGAGLQGLNLSPLDTVDLGDRLRVVLSVNQIQSGSNAGKKKASAVFIWGNQTLKLTGNYVLSLGPQDSTGVLQSTDGKMNLEVKSPDFQAKTSKSTPLIVNAEKLCARLTFNLTADTFNWSSNTPVEVCETLDAGQAELGTLEKLVRGLPYHYQSLGTDTWKATRISSTEATRMPSTVELLTALGLPLFTPVTTETHLQFNQAMSTVTSGVPYAELEKYAILRERMGVMFTETQVYHVRLSSEREQILILGRNDNGVAGVWTYRFRNPDGSLDPATEQAKVTASLANVAGSLVGQVDVGPHAQGAAVSGRYTIRSASTCAAGVNVTLEKTFVPDSVSAPNAQGLVTSKLLTPAAPENLADLVMDYAVTVTAAGSSKTYTGFTCKVKPPPSAALEALLFAPYFGPSGAYIDVTNYKMNVMQGSGTYRIEESTLCGAAANRVIQSGDLPLNSENLGFMWAWRYRVPSPPVATTQMRFVYDLTLSMKDGSASRTVSSGTCGRL